MKRRNLEPIILDTSLRLFRDSGFDNVSVMDICEACDITKPTFYRYAVTKGDLLPLYFKRICQNMDPAWHDVNQQGSWYGCIEAGFLGILEPFLEYGTDFCMQFYIQNIKTETDMFHVNTSFKPQMIECLHQAQLSGDILDNHSPEDLFATLVTSMVGCGGHWILTDCEFDIMERFHTILAVVCEKVS